MEKLKGYKKLNKAVTAQLQPFGIKKAVGGDDYAYYFGKEIVTFRLDVSECDKAFSDFLLERFDYEDTNIFIISLLHEVGHHKTDDDINENIYQFCQQEKARIEEEISHTLSPNRWKELQYQYFNLPDEIMATQWAVNYAKKHPKKVRKMWAECEKALHEFYARNLGVDK